MLVMIYKNNLIRWMIVIFLKMVIIKVDLDIVIILLKGDYCVMGSIGVSFCIY